MLFPMNRFLVAIFLIVDTTFLGADEVDFDLHIRPILAEYCLECHGPDAGNRQGDLRLDIAEAFRSPCVEPGNAAESQLFLRIQSTDDDFRMPPAGHKKELKPAQIETIRRWIDQGAHFEGHWAYQPVRKVLPPRTPLELSEPITDIDCFLLDKLRSRGLSFSPEISRAQWIRRATLDLIGIPPSWEEVDSFVRDESPNAFEKVLDRLLDSPRYGERWGRHWLDIARYADTHGGSAIGFVQFPFSYSYRDYVIHALNSDVPYDRFIQEQIAADQLGLPPNDPSLAALGFLTVGMQYRNRHDIVDDQIDVVTRGLQGLTVSCARCHDHKFDAITIDDYYSLYATFASSQSPERLPVIGQPAPSAAFESYQTELEKAQTEYDDMARDQAEIMRGRLRMQVGLYLREIAKGTPEQDTSTTFLSYRTDDLRPIVLNRWRDYISRIKPTDPVFGIWVQLSQLPEDEFSAKAEELRKRLEQENGGVIDPAAHGLAAASPKWNPRVLAALAAKPPRNMLDVADVFGDLFVTVNREWLQGLAKTAEEAIPNGTIIPDEDAQHSDVNSPVHRQLRHYLFATDTPFALPDRIASSLLNRTVQDTLNGKKGAIHNLNLSSPGSPTRAMTIQESKEAQEFHVFRRGNPLDRGNLVQPRFLSILADQSEAVIFRPGQRRLDLANAIVSRHNPLTRRVLVNWVWQQHFGQGLVATPDDFGTRGRSPTHPELLDYLAEVFLEDGWSIKKLHRRIMLSRAYRQGAIENEKARELDPENELLWRMPRRRLEMEAMRDAMLFVSEELDTRMGGRPVDFAADPKALRRSVYGFVNRDIVSNFASTFDVANPNACTAKRPDTTVPQQTLFALNSDFVQDRAKSLGKLAIDSSSEDAERLRWLYRRALSRDPREKEVLMALEFIQAKSADRTNVSGNDTATEPNSWQQLAHVLLATNEFVFVD